LKLLPYIENHPNIGVYVDNNDARCPNCGSDNLQKRGYAFSNQAKYQRIQCMACGAWARMKQNLLNKAKVKLVSR
jgi:uncharacterized Zn finger protein